MPSRILSTLFLGFAVTLASAQQPEQQPSPSTGSQPGYTLSTGVRIVLTDVTVTDAKGNVVHGIPASAFHISDDNKPQTIKSFAEFNAAPTQISGLPAPASGVYSNEYLKHLPPVLNVIVLDSSRLDMMDQMYLRYELHAFLRQLAPDQPFAIYARSGDTNILVQNFTADHALLAAAIDKSLPHMRVLGADFMTSTSTLKQIALQLAQVPGRKNVLWFAGRRTESVVPDPTERDCAGEDCYRKIYNELQTARIAIYPIDARGINLHAANHIRMTEAAEATGGLAFFNNNDLDRITSHIIATDNSFYTLTYVPENFRPDLKWHKVHVTLDIPGYFLSYRTGYFADNDTASAQPNTTLAKAEPASLPADFRSAPILFSASVVPAVAAAPGPDGPFVALKVSAETPSKGSVPYVIRYTLPPDSFVTHDENGVSSASFDVAVLAFDQNGEKVAVKGDQVSARFPQNDPHQPIKIEQTINLKPGDLYLYVAVWDSANGRVGTLQIPATVPRLPKLKN